MLALRLALAVGRPDVDRMLAEISGSQLAEWAAYDLLEPIGWRSEERRFAWLATIACQSPSASPSDFVYEPLVARERMTDEQIEQRLRAIAARAGR